MYLINFFLILISRETGVSTILKSSPEAFITLDHQLLPWNENNLRVHIERFHRMVVKNPCKFEAESENNLEEHVREKHGDKSKLSLKIRAKNANS